MRSRSILFFLCVALASAASYAQSPAADEAGKEEPRVSWLVAPQPRAVQQMALRGFVFDGMFVNDWSKGFHNAFESAEGFSRSSVDLFLRLDNEKIAGWKGNSALVRFKSHMEQFGAGFDHCAQLYSNIDSPNRTGIYELWMEQKLYGGRLRIKGGKIDSNTEFAVVESAGDFLNSSMGFSPTIMAFPSYPQPKLGLGVFLEPLSKTGLELGIFQTSGMGTLALAEPSRRWSMGGNELSGRASVGYWRLDGSMDRFDGGEVTTTQGFYSVAEQTLWRRFFGNEGGEQKISVFLQTGFSDGAVSSVVRHLGCGFVLQPLFTRRPHDALGLAMTAARFSPRAGLDYANELILETYYKVNLTRQIALVQDFQYLHHPGGMETTPDYPVITPRIVLTF
jgi:porin